MSWKGRIPMKDNEQRMLFRDAADHRLSGLQGDPLLAQRIIAESKGELPEMKKKTSMRLVLAIAAILVVTTALAAGLLFSPRYDASKLANEALLNKYGITEKMMTMFYRETTQTDDANFTVTYTPQEVSRLGVYTVTVNNGKAEAVWSHDGEDTSGGLEAKAWGKEQAEMLVTDYSTVMLYLQSNSDSPLKPADVPFISVEEHAKAVLETKEKVQRAAKITLEKAKESAVAALVGEYGLTDEQAALLQIFVDDETYAFEDGRPTVSLYYHLTQGSEWREKDGIYVVRVNLETGEIENIIYDSTLAGNG